MSLSPQCPKALVKACISLLTLMLVALLYQYYSQLLRTSILRMRHDFEDTLFGTNFGEWFLLEAVVCPRSAPSCEPSAPAAMLSTTTIRPESAVR